MNLILEMFAATCNVDSRHKEINPTRREGLQFKILDRILI